MEFRTDLETVKEGVVCLLAIAVDGGETAVLARRNWFPAVDGAPGERVLAWQETYRGDRLPAAWTPYAYAVVALPDPAIGDDAYG